MRNTTKINKANMIESKILPYLGEKKLTEITLLDILNWQNAIQHERTSNGLHYRDSYLRSISNQLSAMLNHAVRYYNLPSNPMSKVDGMGSKKTDEMKFWTKEEYKVDSLVGRERHGAQLPSPFSDLAHSCAIGSSMRPLSSLAASADPVFSKASNSWTSLPGISSA